MWFGKELLVEKPIQILEKCRFIPCIKGNQAK
jgi:hypothetical protein